MSNYRDQLENYLKSLNIKADTVLDVGGKELPIKDRVNGWKVKNYSILDLPEYNLNVKNQDYYMEADIVFCLEVMEYIWNPNIALENLYDLLKDDGILYITFQFLYPIHEPNQFDYLRFTKEGSCRLLQNAEFEIKQIIPRVMKPESYDLWRKFLTIESMHSSKFVDHSELGWIFKAKKL